MTNPSPDVPEADALEQSLPVHDAPEDGLEEITAPLEADPADVAEQHLEVPDEDDRRD
ncbi:hypothetical protein GC722_08135 [Auraticoccus sp. F435]|uniref:Uncharacterized protein n=1 Tax=Auraticoccus cholistanensis TaxID=2656650 RepID=A0A6A9V0U9_9ACTN|nr:hypothetical protein [Auraticoccus cholistanensis]MVA75990.1 hypothetical protein [Auraticoccus cholistanensis]